MQSDLTAAAAVTDAVGQVAGWKGRIDILVNMAGLYYGMRRPCFPLGPAVRSAPTDARWALT